MDQDDFSLSSLRLCEKLRRTRDREARVRRFQEDYPKWQYRYGIREIFEEIHAACVAFGIPSPKSEEMHGYAVGDAYAEGRLGERGAGSGRRRRSSAPR